MRQRALLLAVSALACAVPLAAQGKGKRVCTVCENDATLLARNGMSHGPFPFAKSDTGAIESEYLFLPVWIETPHLRIGAELETWKVPEEERKAYRAELEALARKWPEIDPKKMTLDPWLRAHLLADRAERFYAQFMQLMGSSDAVFADPEKNRMSGWGPYAGESDKFEVMIFRGRHLYAEFMQKVWGLHYVKPQRYNNLSRDCMWFGFSQEEDGIRHDQHVHSMVRHNLAHNFLDGYHHYSYEMPVWITEGFAHWAEIDNDPRFHMFDFVEGVFQEPKTVSSWPAEVRKMAVGGETVPFTQLLHRKSFAELDFEDHLMAWSKIDFLIRTDAVKFGKFVTTLKNRRDERGYPDGSKMDDAQRDALKQFYGWTWQQAEEHWKEWVLATYPVK
ncbi:MAG: hypothetical protein EYC70_16525 [Planctomycetota bacterium]|nr:MAG: hypothetical protein EYC70_16525 [Planctomycetota bacterium]